MQNKIKSAFPTSVHMVLGHLARATRQEKETKAGKVKLALFIHDMMLYIKKS